MVFDSYIDAAFELPLEERKEYIYAVVYYLRNGRPPKGLKGTAKALITSTEPSLHKSYVRSQAGKAPKKPKKRQSAAMAPARAVEADGFASFLRDSLDAYNDAADTAMLCLPETSVMGLRRAWDSGRRIDDVRAVLDKTIRRWEPRYRSPNAVFGDRFEMYLARNASAMLDEGGDEW